MQAGGIKLPSIAVSVPPLIEPIDSAPAAADTSTIQKVVNYLLPGQSKKLGFTYSKHSIGGVYTQADIKAYERELQLFPKGINGKNTLEERSAFVAAVRKKYEDDLAAAKEYRRTHPKKNFFEKAEKSVKTSFTKKGVERIASGLAQSASPYTDLQSQKVGKALGEGVKDTVKVTAQGAAVVATTAGKLAAETAKFTAENFFLPFLEGFGITPEKLYLTAAVVGGVVILK